MKIIAITQARMNSSRLPGKILKTINDIPLIEYHCERVSRSHKIDHHIIATTDTALDRVIVDYCKTKRLNYYCGSESDVLERFYNAAKRSGAETDDLIIRLTADCPLVSPELIDAAVLAHQKKPSINYTRLNLEYFPRGFDVEVFSMASLEQAYKSAESNYEREHVTPFMYKTEYSHTVQNITTGNKNWSKIRLCVDEEDDFQLVKKVINHFGKDWREAKHDSICQYLLSNPELLSINSSVKQN